MSTAAIVTPEPLPDGQARCPARALRWMEEAGARREATGLYPGWNQCLDQLAALVEKA